MPHEGKRRRDRRIADYRVRSNTCTRRPLQEAEVAEYFKAVDFKVCTLHCRARNHAQHPPLLHHSLQSANSDETKAPRVLSSVRRA